jgi:endoglucanase
MMLDTLRAVLEVPGVSGAEDKIAARIAEIIKPYVDETRTDALGNLIAVKRGAAGGKRVMLSAHMDQIGYVVVDIDKDGFLYVSNVGGIHADDAPGKVVTFKDGLQGVVSAKPTQNGAPRTIQDLFIDIGASNLEEAQQKVQIGDTCSVAFQLVVHGDRVSAPTMDDRSACAVLIETLKALKAPHHTVIAVFSSQEEVGTRGAQVAAQAENPDIGIAVDVTGTGDTPDTKPRLPMKLGAGPCVKIMDRYSITTPSVRDGLIAAANAAGVPYQREVLPFGGTDAGAIQRALNGIPAGTISLACRYVHSPVETVSLKDCEQAVALLAEYLKV